MRYSFSFFMILSPCILLSQTYSTTSQGSNTVGRAYVAPVVTKVYNFNSTGYKAPEKTSFKNYNPNSSIKSPYTASGSRSNSSSFGSTNSLPNPKGRVFKNANGKYGYADGYNKKLLSPIYEDAGTYTDFPAGVDYIWVKLNGKYGILYPHDSKPAIPIEWDEIRKIDNWHAWVRKGNKVGVLYMGKPGKPETSVPVKYDDVGPFDLITVWVKSGGKFGLMSTVNTTVLPVKFDDIDEFALGLYLVKKENMMGLMNRKGDVVLPLQYESISTVVNNAAWILKDKKWGLINDAGVILAIPQYDTVYEQTGGKVWINNLAVVSKENKLIYIDKYGKEAIYSNETSIAASNAAVKTPATPVIETKMEENFKDGMGKYKWPVDKNGQISKGAYVVMPAQKGTTWIEIPFPSNFQFSEKDNWEFEVSMKKVTGKSFMVVGIGFGEIYSRRRIHVLLSQNSASISGVKGVFHLDDKVKKGNNSIRFIKIGTSLEMYLNGKLSIKGVIENPTGGTFWFLVSEDVGNIAQFDDIKFELLEKK
jgi:WG containing repeat